MSTGQARLKRAFAIVRIDLFAPESAPWRGRIAVQRVVWTLEQAEGHVARLMALNADKDCHYFWTATRVEPDERSDVPTESEDEGVKPPRSD